MVSYQYKPNRSKKHTNCKLFFKFCIKGCDAEIAAFIVHIVKMVSQESPFKLARVIVNELIGENVPIKGLCSALLNIYTLSHNVKYHQTVVGTKSHHLNGVNLKLSLFVMYS